MVSITEKMPNKAQLRYLLRGMNEPGGKLPLFGRDGERISKATIRTCLKNGWCKEWRRNPIKPDWLVCKLTKTGRDVVRQGVDSAGI